MAALGDALLFLCFLCAIFVANFALDSVWLALALRIVCFLCLLPVSLHGVRPGLIMGSVQALIYQTCPSICFGFAPGSDSPYSHSDIC